MTTPFTRSFVAATYLLGARGNELGDRVPPEVERVELGLIRGLQSEDRDSRARFLAAAVRELVTEMQVRALGPQTLGSG